MPLQYFSVVCALVLCIITTTLAACNPKDGNEKFTDVADYGVVNDLMTAFCHGATGNYSYGQKVIEKSPDMI